MKNRRNDEKQTPVFEAETITSHIQSRENTSTDTDIDKPVGPWDWHRHMIIGGARTYFWKGHMNTWNAILCNFIFLNNVICE